MPGEVHPPASDEFQCLILQVNVPLKCLQSNASASSKVPVLVYVHGGGFVLGRIDEQHNTALMVEQSLLDSQPIISVSIQYRLGALGYLQTPECNNWNNALYDQRNALIWVQHFIGGFGGDRERVTVFGESAGSMSICTHMLATPPPCGPLFRRAILMSGVPGPTATAISVEDAEKLYETFLDAVGIQERGDAGLEKLRGMHVQKIVDGTAAMSDTGKSLVPVLAQEWFGNDCDSITWDRIPELIGKCEWVKEIVLGTTSFEVRFSLNVLNWRLTPMFQGTMFIERMLHVTPHEFLAGVAEQLGEESAEIVAQAYGVSPDMDQNLFTTRVLRWIGDAIFDGRS